MVCRHTNVLRGTDEDIGVRGLPRDYNEQFIPDALEISYSCGQS